MRFRAAIDFSRTRSARHGAGVAACTTSGLIGVEATASGLGVTLLGRSFLKAGLRILRAPAPWPAPSITEVVLIGEDRAGALMRPLIAFLTESLAGSDALAPAA
ncbi:hypothetical protein [Methylobacterium sp. Leaf89]|uniref:hypothetical protein n=1 Tax=Methylobacterium sp. Leaf89 TaxID=1736245 RepID=UPI0006FA03EF|nr:hypothetical protein ASF18_12650 [Methylobacterium sp. Leaf89]